MASQKIDAISTAGDDGDGDLDKHPMKAETNKSRSLVRLVKALRFRKG